MTDTELSTATAAMIAETTLPVPKERTPRICHHRCHYCRRRALKGDILCFACCFKSDVRDQHEQPAKVEESIPAPLPRLPRSPRKRISEEELSEPEERPRQRECGPGQLPCEICRVPVKLTSDVYEARVRLRLDAPLCSACEQLAQEK